MATIPNSVADALRNIADRKARGRLRAAATVEAIGRELEWLDAEGWRYQLERPPVVTISPKDIERAAATVDLKVWDATNTLIFRDRIHAWDGFPVLVPDGTEHEEDTPTGKVRVSNFRESPLEAARLDLAHTVRVVTKNGPWVKDKPGTVSTFYANTNDDQIRSNNATYSTARTGSNLLVGSGTDYRPGQALSGPSYYGWEVFIQWDTAAIGDSDALSAVTLSLYGKIDESVTDFTLEARLYDWGTEVTTADWIAGENLGSYTRLATFSTTGFTTSSYNDMTEDGTNFQSAVNLTGDTRILLCSDRFVAGTVPTGNEYVVVASADATGTTQDPKLVVTHSAAGSSQAPRTFHQLQMHRRMAS